MTIARLAVLFAASACAAGDLGPAPAQASDRRGLVILGVDGMDAGLARRYLAEGRLPALAALAQGGGFIELATSNPPQSPVAWSHFITGRSSAAHGIYDFVHRDPDALAPYLSTSRARPPARVLALGRWRLPLGGAGMELLRAGEPFWARLTAHGIPATVLKIPAHFPPTGSGGADTLSGMGTPDLLGTYGTFQVLTDEPTLLGRALPGARVHRLARAGREATGLIEGPPHPLLAAETALTLPVKIAAAAEGAAALVRIGGAEVLLRVGEWSPFIPLRFEPGALAGAIPGMVRLYLKSVDPRVLLYVSPINIDPVAPATAISSPPEFAPALAADAGRFYTQGMPEDTKALEGGILSDEEFLAQADLIFEEERALLRRQLASYRPGAFLFHYLSIVDQVSHVFFRALDADRGSPLARHAGVIPGLYARVDALVAEVRAALPAGTAIFVLSDHGFAPFRHKVNLNTWLLRQGFLHLRDEARPGALGHIDWSRTQAYALGLNQLFLNRRGREAAGIVPDDKAAALLDRLAHGLESWIDPVSGARVVSRTFRPPASAHPDRTPDLLVGFARGYRSSDSSATGIPEAEAVMPNLDKWSGDHCMDPAFVPGVLFSSETLAAPSGSLLDIAPTVAAFFGLPPATGAEGKSLLPEASN